MLLIFIFVALVKATIVFEKSETTFPLYEPGSSSKLIVDEADWPGVIRAANDLVNDFSNVTGSKNALQQVKSSDNYCASGSIIVGTIGNSSLIQSYIDQGLIDVSSIENKWESYIITTVDSCNTLVIAGSDKRGSIYGIYTISEQIGVNPLYFWADVPIQHHDHLYFDKKTPIIQGEPSVKYRGIFLNDEEPALSGWVSEKFRKGEYLTHYVHEFYVIIFELLLRLKGNLLWPTMWKSMFALDDEANQYWADYYGIVMSTSHTEPLQRATAEWSYKGEGDWDYTSNKENITEFWRKGIERAKNYEGVWTEGMRGFGDRALSGDVESDLLEEVISDQRDLLIEGFGNGTNISDIPQVWCLYKEVQSYYEAGMSVPDDIILLWVDDNWGNIRRLPLGNETSRPGGAGMYYHFDYVGDPRDYKWINSASLTRTWEQMHMAHQKMANQLWVVNVGDLKGLEIPVSYFLDLGYNFDKWGGINQVFNWIENWTSKQFGHYVNESTVHEIAQIIDEYSFLVGRRKYELLNGTIYSLTNYNEAMGVLGEWSDLSDRAWKVYNHTLPQSAKPAFFEMILHPCHAGYILHDMYIASGKNEFYSKQRRNQANYYAEHVRQRFYDDYDLQNDWDDLLDGKWVHMMDQTHIGFEYWQQPIRNSMPFVSEFILGKIGLSGSAAVTADQSLGVVPGDDLHNAVSYDNNTIYLPELNPYSQDTWIEVFSRGYEDFDFELTAWNDYVQISPSSGTMDSSNSSIYNSLFSNVSIDWDKAPEGWSLQYINFTANVSSQFYEVPTILFLPINNTKVPEDFTGFVEDQGHVSFEADHFTGNNSQNDTHYVTIERFGRTKSGVTLFPVSSDSQLATEDASYLEYDFYAFTGSNVTNVTMILSPSQNINPHKPLRYAVGVDNQEPVEIQVYEDASDPTAYPKGWEEAVAQNAWLRETMHDVSSGKHTLKVWLLEVNVVVQKIVIDFGGVQESYLGPPESHFIQ